MNRRARALGSRGSAVAPPAEAVEHRIYVIRGERVMLDADLAALYGVPTKRLNQAVRRNPYRFPADFSFQLTPEEAGSLRSQNVTSNAGGRGGRRYLPYAFTEEGVAMLSSVLASDRAAAVNVLVMRAFVRLRRAQLEYVELRQRIEDIADRVAGHDALFEELLAALDALARPDASKSRQIGFRPK